MSVFKELQNKIESSSNSNFYFDKMDLPTRVWIMGICDLIEQHLNDSVEPDLEAMGYCGSCACRPCICEEFEEKG